MMDGILVINKPYGMTSHDVIARLRKKYKQKKFGHTGTLDPNATGVLVVLCGRACKALQFLENQDKTYIATMALGKKTDTDDIWGEVVETRPVQPIENLQAVLDTMVGAQKQQVPDTSAKKIAGKKLYEYQREGKEVPRVFADSEIYRAKVLDKRDVYPLDLPGHRGQDRQRRDDDFAGSHAGGWIRLVASRRSGRAKPHAAFARVGV